MPATAGDRHHPPRRPGARHSGLRGPAARLLRRGIPDQKSRRQRDLGSGKRPPDHGRGRRTDLHLHPAGHHRQETPPTNWCNAPARIRSPACTITTMPGNTSRPISTSTSTGTPRPCCFSIWTISNASTTCTGTWKATPRWSASRKYLKISFAALGFPGPHRRRRIHRFSAGHSLRTGSRGHGGRRGAADAATRSAGNTRTVVLPSASAWPLPPSGPPTICSFTPPTKPCTG